MILITKPNDSPGTLSTRGVVLTQRDCNNYDGNPTLYIAGEEFPLSGIYKSKLVRKALRKAQNNKCAYCEKSLSEEASYVDHYRPQKSITVNNRRQYPGYYWLTYSWNNLFLACLACNSTYKKDQFPLALNRTRALNHHDRVELEDPLILNPSGPIDPRDHIRFRNDAPFAVNGSRKGKKTIEILSLDSRESLLRDRRDRLNILRLLKEAIEGAKLHPETGLEADLTEHKQFLRDAVLPSAPHSSMARDFLEDFLRTL